MWLTKIPMQNDETCCRCLEQEQYSPRHLRLLGQSLSATQESPEISIDLNYINSYHVMTYGLCIQYEDFLDIQ